MSSSDGQTFSASQSARSGGDRSEVEELLQCLCAGMRAEAARHTRTIGEAVTLDTGALMRDVLRETQGPELSDFRARSRLLSSASCAIRHLLVDYARDCRLLAPARLRASATNGVEGFPVLGRVCFDGRTVKALLELDAALDALAEVHPRWVDVMHCVFFGRMSFAETAAALDATPGAVRSDWVMTRIWVHNWIMKKDQSAAANRAPP